MAWYREWFGEEYLDLYAHHDADEAEEHVDFVEELFGKPRPRAVLDLACGPGRHTEALRRRGYRALGVDLSLTLLALRPDLPRVRGDMRGLPFVAASFDWILNFFTSFGYFETEQQNLRVLQEMARLLIPGGRYLIDILNVDYVLPRLVAEETIEGDDGRQVRVQRWYDAGKKRLNKRIEVASDGAPARIFLESVRVYRAEEAVAGLRRVGLEVKELYGNFQGESHSRDSERLILVGRQPS